MAENELTFANSRPELILEAAAATCLRLTELHGEEKKARAEHHWFNSRNGEAFDGRDLSELKESTVLSDRMKGVIDRSIRRAQLTGRLEAMKWIASGEVSSVEQDIADFREKRAELRQLGEMAHKSLGLEVENDD